MTSEAIRVYADTSVFGGVFDSEFEKGSVGFFDLVKRGNFQLVISALVEDELGKAPKSVRAFYEEIRDYAKLVDLTPEAIALQRAYMEANILTSQWEQDAQHVALASVAECAIIISWNFRHIVNFRKISLYNAVNMSLNYKTIAIHSPMEVIADGT